MAYSRWGGGSKWYVYHDADSGKTKDTQIVTVCGEASFTYQQLIEDFEHCVKSINGDDDLRKSLKLFMLDVEEDFK